MRMKVFLFTVMLAFSAAADEEPVPPAETSQAEAEGASTPSEPAASAPSADDMVASVVKVAADWKAGGALAGVAALLALLLQISKMDLFRKLLDDKGRDWMRPLGLTLLATAGGLVSALQAGAPLGAAALAGAMAGLSGIGGRELLKHLSPAERSRVRVGVDAVAQAADVLQAQLETNAAAQGPEAVAALAPKLAAMKTLPIRTRLEGLTALAVPAKAA